MICTTIQNRNLEEILAILEGGDVEMAEIRLDRCPLDLDEIQTLFSYTDTPLVATCRLGEGMTAPEAEARLVMAVRSGAAYLDVEIEAPPMFSKRLRREAQQAGTILIRSYHDFQGTDSTFALKAIAEKCLHLGADVVKIVTTAHCSEDCDKVLSLYSSLPQEKLIAFCMGEEGRRSRLECIGRGAPYTYAALTSEEAAAPGQWDHNEMQSTLYGDFPRIESRDVLSMPCSKSFAQRAIIAAALAEGTSTLRGYSPCGDSEAALEVARTLGAKVSRQDDTIAITGIGGPLCPSFDGNEINTGESGFLTRLMIPLLGVIGGGNVHVSGEKTLLRRPLTGASEIMRTFGVELTGDTPEDEARIPLTVKGHLESGEKVLSGKNGSQLISGLLCALPLLDEDSTLVIENPKSIPYLFITLDVLKKFGIRLDNEMEGGEEFFESHDWSLCEKITFHIRGGQRYKAADISLEADWSGAAPFLVAGAIFGKVEVEGLDTRSLQADLSIMDIITQAGAGISEYEDPTMLHVQKAPLYAFEVDASNCPDLFPVISVLAAFCEGRSRLGGVGRLYNKESDRAGAILEMLRKMGVRCSIKGDNLLVDGMSLSHRILSGNLLHGGEFTSHKDHRMVMALLVAALGADGKITIDDTSCVSKSFPSFLETFALLTPVNN